MRLFLDRLMRKLKTTNNMSIKNGLYLLLFLLYNQSVLAQTSCNCNSLFNEVLTKIEANYIGYALTKNSIEKEYQAHIQKYDSITKNTKEEDCAKSLQAFLRFFKDGHLFVSEYPNFSQQELATNKSKIKNSLFDVSAIKTYLIQNKENLANIEGLWTDGVSKFSIVKNQKKDLPFDYAAIITSSPDKQKEGEIKFTLNNEEGRFEGTYFSDSYSSRYISVKAYKNNSLLSIWGGLLWGRIANSDSASIDNATLFNPSLPKVEAIDTTTTLISLPTFLIDKQVLDNVLMSNFDLITSSRNVIIDIRGNTGGNGIYMDLISLYADKPLKSDIGKALASEDNIAYFKKFSNSNPENPYAPVVDDMLSSPGEIVKGPRFSDRQLSKIPSKVEHIAILTDEGNMSAAETFVLFSKAISDKVITIGTNTGGVVDYNNINMIKLGCGKFGTHLGYPTYTLHSRIPDDGYNSTGIKPDVYYRNEDAIMFATQYLKKLE